MSDSDIKPPSTYYMAGASIKMIVSEYGKPKLLEGKINSFNKEMKTIDITLQTTDKIKTVNLNEIKEVINDELHGRALIVSRFYPNPNGQFTMHNPSDMGNVPSKPIQTPQTPQTPQLDPSGPISIFEDVYILGNDQLNIFFPAIRTSDRACFLVFN
ncbi:hypothetical protein I5P86_01345 [Pseudomonas glycinae]|uniref:hypothetical protein n=1 Tax=Pseudomonas glycinae TaxID=1785145 RepID=UPI0018D61FCD|nr:hypothetical protein [Pseudomonas glycinae]MBH3403688.1 hypothetical protein [Pseudomonas glycinae]